MEDHTPIPEGSLPRAGQVYQNEHEIYLNLGGGGPYRVATYQDVQYKTVDTIVERNAIDEIFRTEGMLVWVNDELEHYMLVGGLENTNWTPYLSGTYATITGSNINLAAFRTALNVNLTDNTSDLNKPISTATQTALDLKQSLSAKNQANGYAGLDSGALIPLSLFPDSVLGNLKYGGTYNGTVISASDDFPELNGQNLPTTGYVGVYFITTAQFTRATVTYDIGDWIIHNGSNNYVKVDNSDAVTTVFGRLGNVVANEADYSAFYLPIANPTFTGTITGGSSVLSGSATVGTYIYGASSKRLAYTAGSNINILYSGGAGGLTINNQADNLALVNISDAGILTVHPLAGSGERSLVATSTGAIAISASPFITAAQNYYIGTTQNALNRASAGQTLTGVSIDGNSATTTLAANSTLLGGYSPSETATDNTIVKRSGSGLALISGGYLETTLANTDAVTIDNFATFATGSGVIRKNSIGAVQTALGLGTNAYTSTAYLPLTAGSGSPLSGSIYIQQASGNPLIKLENTSSGSFPLYQLVDNRTSGGQWNIEGGRTLGSFSIFDAIANSTRYTIDASGNNTWTGSGTFGGLLTGSRSGVSRQIYIERTGSSAGGAYIGADANGFFIGDASTSNFVVNPTTGALTGTSATFSVGDNAVASQLRGATGKLQFYPYYSAYSSAIIQSVSLDDAVFRAMRFEASSFAFNAPITGTSATFNDLTMTGVGNISTPAGSTIYSAGAQYIRSGTGQALRFGANNTNDLMVLASSGNVLIGTTTDNGIDKLQVNGSISGTSATFSSDVEVTDNTKGIILKSPDSTRYRVTVANGGTLTVTAV